MAKGHRWKDMRRITLSEPHPNPKKKHMRINPHTNEPFKKDDRTPLIPTPDGKDYTKTNHNNWKFFLHYKKIGRSPYLPNMKERELDSKGFYYEQWLAYIPDSIEPKVRNNPHTGRNFQRDEPRPTIPSEDGKIYPQDDFLFSGYRYDNVDRNDYYRENWVTGYVHKCVKCNKTFRTTLKKRKNCKECKSAGWHPTLLERIGVGDDEKICASSDYIKSKTGCDWEPKKKSEFQTYKASTTGVRSYCKKCQPLDTRNRKLKRRFDITLEEYDQMVEKQNDRCWICNTKDKGQQNFKKKKKIIKNKNWQIDHFEIEKNGKTIKVVRGLLCTKCNTGIGQLKHSKKLLARASDYLDQRPVEEFRKNKKKQD